MAVFLLNMAVMYVFFDINFLKLQELSRGRVKSEQRDSGEPAGSGVKANEKIESQKDSQTKQVVTGEITEPDNLEGYFVSPGEIAFMKNLGLEDKLLAMNIASKLGSEEVKRIYGMALDGITAEEYAELMANVEGKLAISDIEAIEELLSRNKMLYAENDR